MQKAINGGLEGHHLGPWGSHMAHKNVKAEVSQHGQKEGRVMTGAGQQTSGSVQSLIS